LVRPSYVLGGQGMSIVINDEDLEKAVVNLLKNLPGNRVLIDHFLDRAAETESDSIHDGDDVHIIGLMEHIEPAGIHSGDSFAVLPPFDLSRQRDQPDGRIYRQNSTRLKRSRLAEHTVCR
jgi:carbamoyl-phosphate synthase large subunit